MRTNNDANESIRTLLAHESLAANVFLVCRVQAELSRIITAQVPYLSAYVTMDVLEATHDKNPVHGPRVISLCAMSFKTLSFYHENILFGCLSRTSLTSFV